MSTFWSPIVHTTCLVHVVALTEDGVMIRRTDPTELVMTHSTYEEVSNAVMISGAVQAYKSYDHNHCCIC